MEQNGPVQFGPYVVLEQIGAGGMGAVYRARDRRLERDVAIKVLHRHLEMAGARERFLREARAVSSLNHPNISTIFDIGEQDGDPYLVMELLHGESLKERLEDNVLMPQDDLISIAMQAAQALAAAHAKGIVHRDVKPANLFLVDGPAGQPQLKVLDFGLAKIESDRLLHGDSGGLTRTGSTVGTVEYMSPEQARGEDLDPRSDLFSLGAVLYELATGDVPFRGATSAVVFAELLGSDPVPPRKANARVSPGLDSVIRKLLEKKRENRTPSANALLDELRKLKESSARGITAAPPNASAANATQPAPESSRRIVQRAPVSVNDPGARAIRGRTPSGNLPPTLHKSGSDDKPAAAVARASGGTPPGLREPVRRGVASERPTAAPPLEERDPATGGVSWWVPCLVGLLLVGIAAAYYLRPHGEEQLGVSVVTGGLQITQFDNSTGDAILQDIPAVALQILLRELPTLHLTGYAPAPGGADRNAAELAQRSGADAYLTGTVSRDADRYHIHAEILRTSDNGKLAAEDVDAGSAVQVPEALGRLAIALRAHLGETPEQATTNTVPLTVEATNSLNALAFYARGTSLLRVGQTVAALEQFNHALTEDAAFVPARLELVEALREAGAEPERLRAAALLKSSVARGSACQRARVAYELADTASAAASAQAWADTCSLQPEAQIALARASLASGRNGAAEAAGGKAAELDPAGRAALTVATETMIAQAHYESAEKEQARAAGAGAGSPGLSLLAADLRGDDSAVAQAAADARSAAGFWDGWHYVTYLSNRGRLAEAHTFGETVAQRLSAQPAVASSAELMRARLAAMDAMAGHCGSAATASSGAGDTTRFFAGLSAAWCKRPASVGAPADPALSGAVRAAITWSKGDAQGALNLLQGARDSNQSPVASLLRGQAHLALGQQVLAISDFNGVIAHRGAALLTGTLVYPAAQAGLAAAYRTMGDTPNADRAADDLRSTWKDAAPTEPPAANDVAVSRAPQGLQR